MQCAVFASSRARPQPQRVTHAHTTHTQTHTHAHTRSGPRLVNKGVVGTPHALEKQVVAAEALPVALRHGKEAGDVRENGTRAHGRVATHAHMAASI